MTEGKMSEKKHKARQSSDETSKATASKKNKFTKETAKRWAFLLFCPPCVYYTVLSLILFAGEAFNESYDIPFLDAPHMLLLFVFLFIFNVANIFLTKKRYNLALRIAVHFVLTAASFFVCFYILSDYSPGTSATIIQMLVFVIAYAAVCALVLIVRGIFRHTAEESESYEPMYKPVYKYKK